MKDKRGMLGEKLKSNKVYLEEMRKPMEDKLFFIDFLRYAQVDTIVDYGCADGTMTYIITKEYKGVQVIGVDCNEEFIREANNNFKSNRCKFKVIQKNEVLKAPTDNSALVLSSVVHEIYCYNKRKDINSFWNNVLKAGYRYIIVRDMVFNTRANSDKVKGYASVLYNRINSNEYEKKRLEEFESIWGKITNKRNFHHYLLKYRYTINWDREVHEDYLGCSPSKIIKELQSKYEVFSLKQYKLPFINEQAKKDFGVEFLSNTHFKLVLRLRS